MVTIKQAQDTVFANSPDSRYANYSNYELDYWGPIPLWLEKRFKEINNVLDIGIAYGSLSTWIHLNTNATITGVDFIKYISDDLVKKFNFNYYLRNIELENIPSTDYDTVILTEVLEHLNFNPVLMLTKVYNSMKTGGRLYISTPDSSSAWGKVNMYQSWKNIPAPNPHTPILDQHIYQYNMQEVEELLGIVGFIILNKDSVGTGRRHLVLECIK